MKLYPRGIAFIWKISASFAEKDVSLPRKSNSTQMELSPYKIDTTSDTNGIDSRSETRA
jgi:hypothetical protein